MPTESNKPKSSRAKSHKRREELRRSIPKPTFGFRSIVLRREFVLTALIFAVFLAAAGGITLVAHDQILVSVGQIMTDARTVRIRFNETNESATERERQRARDLAPHVYVLNDEFLEQLAAELTGLPAVVHGKTELDAVAEEVRNKFALTQERLESLQAFAHVAEGAEQPEADPQWQQWVDVLLSKKLVEHPTISSEDYQRELIRSATPMFQMPGGQFIPREPQEARAETVFHSNNRWYAVILDAGFPESIAPSVASAISRGPNPLYRFDDAKTRALADQRATEVAPVTETHKAGEPLYLPGDVLTAEQYAVLHQEHDNWNRQATWVERSFRALGDWGVVGFIIAIMAGYLVRFYPRVTRNPLRSTAIAVASVAMLGTCVFISVKAPPFLYLGAVSTSLFLALMLVIAYDQRLAATLSVLHCAMVVFALDESLAFFMCLAATCGTGVMRLREVRHRNTLIQASVMAAGIAVIGSLIVGILETPLTNSAGEEVAGVWKQIASNASLAGLGAAGTGFVILGILPSVERVFDITTGMTLVELRDPRQPLLRQLQERAPGTYNHSLQVASVAEAAADAIGADSLLTYVGALYHDVGKMNKPDYFVENQSGGPNKHEKLSPAMSLLVIIGHVKDGVELAREYNLPRTLLHFIESHHGTTLVEYFFHAAREKAQAEGDADRVEEVEFRYPGPRPKHKEAAILMLADASESATRAMEQPSHKAIETLVRKLSRRRLDDGQFDECDITLRELTMVEDAIIKTLWSIYHGRVAYPSDADDAHDRDSVTTTRNGSRRQDAPTRAAG